MSKYWQYKTSHHDDTKLHTTPKVFSIAGPKVTRHVNAWNVNDTKNDAVEYRDMTEHHTTP